MTEIPNLRCPYPECKVGDKPMKLLLLNVHLEWNHNRLKKLVEKDNRKGMDEVFLACYDSEGYKKKKSLESLLQIKPKVEPELMPAPPASSTKFELSEEEEDVDDPNWRPAVTKPAPPPTSALPPKPAPRVPVAAPRVSTMPSRPKMEMGASYTIHSTVSTPMPCLLCKEKSGKDLRLVAGRTSEVFCVA